MDRILILFGQFAEGRRVVLIQRQQLLGAFDAEPVGGRIIALHFALQRFVELGMARRDWRRKTFRPRWAVCDVRRLRLAEADRTRSLRRNDRRRWPNRVRRIWFPGAPDSARRRWRRVRDSGGRRERSQCRAFCGGRFDKRICRPCGLGRECAAPATCEVVTWKRVTRTMRSPAARAVASENCMMPRGPAGLVASASPQLSRYATAEISEAGQPLSSDARRKMGASRAPVILSAPASAWGSRMMVKVCD